MRCEKRRGQAGIEYVILIGLLLVFLVPVINYSLRQANFNVKVNQIDSVVRRLAESADAVCAMGPGAREVIPITLPNGIVSSLITNREITIKITMLGSDQDISAFTNVQLSGALPVERGGYYVAVECLEEGLARIGVGPMIRFLQPETVHDQGCCVDPATYTGAQSFQIIGDGYCADSNPGPNLPECEDDGDSAVVVEYKLDPTKKLRDEIVDVLNKRVINVSISTENQLGNCQQITVGEYLVKIINPDGQNSNSVVINVVPEVGC